jgi:hypothetical protein
MLKHSSCTKKPAGRQFVPRAPCVFRRASFLSPALTFFRARASAKPGAASGRSRNDHREPFALGGFRKSLVQGDKRNAAWFLPASYKPSSKLQGISGPERMEIKHSHCARNHAVNAQDFPPSSREVVQTFARVS